PARQKTLRDTLAWSYDLLEPEEQILFARLGVFAGGWTLDNAAEVCGGDLQLPVESAMESLLNKSLLRREKGFADEPRFMMLEHNRENAQEKLAERGEHAHLTERHAHYFLALVEKGADAFYTPDEASWLARLEPQHDNLRAALRWSFTADITGEM